MAPLTRVWIGNKFVNYFMGQHHVPREFFATDPDIKGAFNYETRDWAELADVFNDWDWMTARDITLAQPEMNQYTKISTLTEVVYGRANAPAGAFLAMAMAGGRMRAQGSKKARSSKKRAVKRPAKKAGKKKSAKKRTKAKRRPARERAASRRR